MTGDVQERFEDMRRRVIEEREQRRNPDKLAPASAGKQETVQRYMMQQGERVSREQTAQEPPGQQEPRGDWHSHLRDTNTPSKGETRDR